MLDGEVVWVSDQGDVDLYRFDQRMLTRRAKRMVTWCLLDVVWLAGIDCTPLTYQIVDRCSRWSSCREQRGALFRGFQSLTRKSLSSRA